MHLRLTALALCFLRAARGGGGGSAVFGALTAGTDAVEAMRAAPSPNLPLNAAAPTR